MDVAVLQSGSNGNCFFVASGGEQLVIDAGISGRQAATRLRELGFEISRSHALLITHDHRDHAQNLGIFHRLHGLPVYITEPTLKQVRRWCRLGDLRDGIRHFAAGESFSIGRFRIHSIPTPHDGVDGVAFVIDDGEKRVGILTDLGCEFDGLREVLRSLDACIIESNYDEDMLANGPYDMRLKRRIQGPGGHLSNREAAVLLNDARQSANGRMQWACLCHLSAENNTPEVAVQTSRALLGEDFQLFLAHRDRATDLMRINNRAVAGTRL